MRASSVVVPLIAAFLAACATWRWSGSPPLTGPKPYLEGPEVHVSTTPAARVAVPPTPEDRAKGALFYSDMGPETVDVSGYPTQQQRNYAVFARACSSCHTLARAVNAPMVGRGWWEFYILGMRMRGARQGRPLEKDEVSAILDFLEFDSRVRKVDDARRFDQLTEELKDRFDKSVARRLHDLQKANPRPLEPARR